MLTGSGYRLTGGPNPNCMVQTHEPDSMLRLGIIRPKTGQEGQVWPSPLGSDSKGLASAFGFG